MGRGGAPSGAQSLFLNGFMGISDVVESYRQWLAIYFYVVCNRFVRGDFEYGIFHSLKRGDERYSALVCRKFAALGRFGKGLSYFGDGVREAVSGSGLLVTLEYDSNKIGLADAWLRVGVDLNRWICGIRRKFGKVSMIRVFESHESGYPHVHALLVFHEYSFFGRSMKNKRGRLIYRVVGADFDSLKSVFHGSVKIGDRWSHGFSDFEMVSSYGGGIRYLAKYLGKSTSFELAGSKGALTLAMCWVFGKRSFGFQGELFVDEIYNSSSSNLENPDGCVSDLNMLSKWRLIGFIVRDTVLWSGKGSSRFVRGSDLVMVEECNCGDGYGSPNIYDVDSKVFSALDRRRSELLDGGSCRKLIEF